MICPIEGFQRLNQSLLYHSTDSCLTKVNSHPMCQHLWGRKDQTKMRITEEAGPAQSTQKQMEHFQGNVVWYGYGVQNAFWICATILTWLREWLLTRSQHILLMGLPFPASLFSHVYAEDSCSVSGHQHLMTRPPFRRMPSAYWMADVVHREPCWVSFHYFSLLLRVVDMKRNP